VLGLGIGTVAAYCEPGDSFRAYEINPDVIQIATNVFTFWSLFEERGAQAEIVMGDARISLERERDRGRRQDFDVLVLDVFTGDAIPVHLLTREAFATYYQHLAENGILAVHVSNRHLNLLPVVRAMATQFDVDMAYVGVEEPLSEWVLLAELDVLQAIAAAHEGKMVRVQQTEGSVIWTDDYSNIFSVLR
jgi:spermidine synthase